MSLNDQERAACECAFQRGLGWEDAANVVIQMREYHAAGWFVKFHNIPIRNAVKDLWREHTKGRAA